MKPNHSEILRAIEVAFTPASAIETPKLFCGRENEIVRGLKALRSAGASLCVYGMRGVGKSSLAKQLMLVGAGLSDLTEMTNRSDLFDPQLFRMPNVYFACDATINNAEDLFRKLLSDHNSFSGIARYNDGIILKRIKTTKSRSQSLALSVLQAASDEKTETEPILPELDYISAFKTVTADIVDAAAGEAMIVVVDDFESVSDKIGISSIIRTTPHVKFILVGVADDYRMLISDHESVSRQLGEGLIKVGLMDDKMLVAILARAEGVLAEIYPIRFRNHARARIVAAARGFPYWVHRLGKECCFCAVENKTTDIDDKCFEAALKRVVRDDISLDDRYRGVVGSDKATEAVLRVFAFDSKQEHTISDLESALERNADLPSGTVKDKIRTLERAGVLRITREGFCSFADLRFKGYAGIREPLFDENTEENLTAQDTSTMLQTLSDSWANTIPITVSYADVMTSYQDVHSVSNFEGDPLLYDWSGKVIRRKKDPSRSWLHWSSGSKGNS
jgi:Cdc6-like AAA superfamily ATPase